LLDINTSSIIWETIGHVAGQPGYGLHQGGHYGFTGSAQHQVRICRHLFLFLACPDGFFQGLHFALQGHHQFVMSFLPGGPDSHQSPGVDGEGQ
jgi:hypothetical protein